MKEIELSTDDDYDSLAVIQGVSRGQSTVNEVSNSSIFSTLDISISIKFLLM